MATGARAFLDDKEWRKYLKNTQRTIKTINKTLQVAYSTIGFRDILKHFNAETGPRGRWPSAKPGTFARRPKGRKRISPKLLQDTGNLRRNFLPTNSKKINNKSILIFNNAPYSAVHDNGSRRKNIPQRKFMWFSDRALNAMSKFLLSKVT